MDVQVLANIEAAPQHVFLLLTKNPERLQSVNLLLQRSAHLWVGTSLSNDNWQRLQALADCKAHHRFLSFEPLRTRIRVAWAALHGIDWVIIGGQSRPWIHPDPAWIDELIRQAHEYDIPVLVKRNAGYPNGPQEWPPSILEHLQPKVGGDS